MKYNYINFGKFIDKEYTNKQFENRDKNLEIRYFNSSILKLNNYEYLYCVRCLDLTSHKPFKPGNDKKCVNIEKNEAKCYKFI
ncbi:MAG: hypothetical protein Satyrvirus44_3 [Satyrvirus sp.]|uniref:Uncharacterized protein n=1 Tax=Satyrvirus sp. TaxID=2487771 RepID=A0A3G5AF98_9VIRU|nr:MAG: hypothetical protein Satyrvirus44_3 [Satyrvirus sp.]